MIQNILKKAVLFILFFAFTINLSLATEYFERIKISGNFEVELVHGGSNDVKIHNDQDHVNMKVESGKLILSMNALDKLKLNKHPRVYVTVTYIKLKEVHGSAGSSIEHKGVLKATDLELRFTSGSEGDIEINSDNVEINVNSGGKLVVSGKAVTQESKASSGGNLRARDLRCKYVYVKANSGGNAEVHATLKIEATANSGGSVEYDGDPQDIERSSGIGGTIRRI